VIGPVLASIGTLGVSIFGTTAQVGGAVEATLRNEIGSAPVDPQTDEAETTFATELRPGALLRIDTARSTLTLRFDPRIYHRTPNLAGSDRPLVLYQGGAAYGRDLSPRLRWTTAAGASYGEVDYTSPQLAFASPIAGEIETPVVKRITLDASTGLTAQLSRRQGLEANASVSHLESTGVESGAEASFPTTTTYALLVAHAYALDELSTLSFPVQPRYFVVDPGPDWISGAVGVAYRRQLTPRANLNGLLGVVLTKVDGEETNVYPNALLSYTNIIIERPNANLTNQLEAVLDATLDPTTGNVRPTLGLHASLRSYLGNKWLVDFQAAGDTTTSAGNNGQGTDGERETLLSASTAVGYRLMNEVRLDGGVRWSTRATNLFADDADLRDRQVFAFLGATAVFDFGSGQRGGAWAR
jgi:hypothetical protein